MDSEKRDPDTARSAETAITRANAQIDQIFGMIDEMVATSVQNAPRSLPLHTMSEDDLNAFASDGILAFLLDRGLIEATEHFGAEKVDSLCRLCATIVLSMRQNTKLKSIVDSNSPD